MTCPSDFRSGDQYDSRSPFYEGDEGPSIVVPYDFEDEDGVARRAYLAVSYDYESDDDLQRATNPEITEVVISGISMSLAKAGDVMGDYPSGKELAKMVDVAEGWQKTAYIDFPARNLAGNDVTASLVVSYTAFPPLPGAEVSDKAEIRDVCSERFIYVKGGMACRTHEFLSQHPGSELPGIDTLRLAVAEYHAQRHPDMFSKKSSQVSLFKM